jgi:hypothetical protein
VSSPVAASPMSNAVKSSPIAPPPTPPTPSTLVEPVQTRQLEEPVIPAAASREPTTPIANSPTASAPTPKPAVEKESTPVFMPSRPLPIPSSFNPPSVIVTPKLSVPERKPEGQSANTQLPLQMPQESKPAVPTSIPSASPTQPPAPNPIVHTPTAPVPSETRLSPSAPSPQHVSSPTEPHRPQTIHTHPPIASDSKTPAPSKPDPIVPAALVTPPAPQHATPRTSDDDTSM